MRAAFVSFIVSGLIFSSCNKNEEPSIYRNLTLKFNHLVNGHDLEVDRMIYENAAGNPYEVTHIQWFISDLKLGRQNGEEILIQDPHLYDHDDYGGKIMDDQEAMDKISDNGLNVFSISFPGSVSDI